MFAHTRRFPTTITASAVAVTLGLTTAPAATAQPIQLPIPGSSFGVVLSVDDEAPALDPASDEYREQLAEATNAARVTHGQQPLRSNAALSAVATAWSGVQADANRMHHNPNLRDEIPGGAQRWSENVLQNVRSASPQQLVDQWLSSPGHRINLLRADHTDFGVGVAVADDGRLYATQVFARY